LFFHIKQLQNMNNKLSIGILVIATCLNFVSSAKAVTVSGNNPVVFTFENPRNEKATDFHINVGRNTSIVGGAIVSDRKFTNGALKDPINQVIPGGIITGNFSSYTLFGSVPISDSVSIWINSVGIWELDVTFSYANDQFESPTKRQAYPQDTAPPLDAYVQISIIDQKIIDATGIYIDAYIQVEQAQQVPEPFTIIGTLIGGTVAFRMKKKLKAIAS
jgi:hypothetical protein